MQSTTQPRGISTQISASMFAPGVGHEPTAHHSEILEAGAGSSIIGLWAESHAGKDVLSLVSVG